MVYSTAMLVIDHVTRFYGAKKALDGVAFDVAPGEVLGVLGPNGAGKSTLLRTIAGILEPTSGDIRHNGRPTFPPTLAGRRAFGFLAEDAPLYPEMTATEHLRYRARLKGYKEPRLGIRLKEMMETAGVGEFEHTRCAALSAGQRRRLALADAMFTHPAVLLLDALFDNLDLPHAQRIRSVLDSRAAHTCVLITGHNLHALAGVCTRYITLHNGRQTAAISATDAPPDKLHALLARSITEPLFTCA